MTHAPELIEIPVFFSEAMVADAHHYSPSAQKPRAVVASWQSLGIPLHIEPPTPVLLDDYCLAHDPGYVEGVLSGRIVNGFGNRKPEVTASLAHTNGAMLAAAREALRNGKVAVAPCSGFHHAGYAYGGDYCTFNGLMIAALRLRAEGLVRHVSILDFDMHYGDGTDDIINRLALNDAVFHYSAGAHWTEPAKAGDFLGSIEMIVAALADSDLLLYQPSGDQHINDPLGGFLTTEQLMERDRRVFMAAKSRGLPIAWNLAGGYQRDADGGIRPVLEIHDNTMKVCCVAGDN